MSTSFPVTDRNRIRRNPKRANYDQDAVHAILDKSLFAHIGYIINDQPYVTCTSFWRADDWVYWHGSSASRMLRAQAEGIPVCFTVAHVDGLVMARSAFHHSVNYRTVMAFGNAVLIEDDAHREQALEHMIDIFYPGRRAHIRMTNAQELKATKVLGLHLDEAVAKVRTGPPVDDDEDMDLDVWAGVVPIATTIGSPIPDPAMTEDRPEPDWISPLRDRLSPPD